MLKHNPSIEKGMDQVIDEVLLKKILDFTVDTVGIQKSYAYIQSKLEKLQGKTPLTCLQCLGKGTLEGDKKDRLVVKVEKLMSIIEQTQNVISTETNKFINYVALIKYEEWAKNDLRDTLVVI